MSRRDELRRIAVALVAETQPTTPNALVSMLRTEYGASHAEANRTMLELIRDRHLRRTSFGELILPGAAGVRGGGGYPVALKAIGVVLILAIVAFIAWVAYNMATREPPGFPPGSAPVVYAAGP